MKQTKAAHPGISVSGVPGVKPGMSEEEAEYRILLQEAVLWATKEIMAEHKAEILLRAEARVKTLIELRG